MFKKEFYLHKKTRLRKNKIKKILYKHGSMFGTYNRECKIIQDNLDGTVWIEFHDPYINQTEERCVKYSELTYE